MEHCHFSWGNSLFQWWFSIVMLVITRGYMNYHYQSLWTNNYSPLFTIIFITVYHCSPLLITINRLQHTIIHYHNHHVLTIVHYHEALYEKPRRFHVSRHDQTRPRPWACGSCRPPRAPRWCLLARLLHPGNPKAKKMSDLFMVLLLPGLVNSPKKRMGTSAFC